MVLTLSAAEPQRFPIPWRPCRIYVRRVDTDAAYVVLYWRWNPRGWEIPLARVSAVLIPEDVEAAEVVIRGKPGLPATARVELLVDRGEGVLPIPISITPRGGRIVSGTLTLTTTPQRLPAYEVVENRDVLLMALDSNAVNVYVNGFPLAPGTVLMVQPSNLSEVEVWAESGTAQLSYLAEVRG